MRTGVMAVSRAGMSFEEALGMGRSGEERVVGYLERNGWWTFPSYKYTNVENGAGPDAPKITRGDESQNTVDIEAFLDGVQRWVEVKTKSNPRKVPAFLDHEYQQGMDLDCWRGYKQFQQTTGINVWVFFCEDSKGTFAIATLDFLKNSIEDIIDKDHERYDPRKQEAEMIYWRRCDLRVVEQDATPTEGAFGDESMMGWL